MYAHTLEHPVIISALLNKQVQSLNFMPLILSFYHLYYSIGVYKGFILIRFFREKLSFNDAVALQPRQSELLVQVLRNVVSGFKL